jgi:tetratricopeptide (TPR) repeat protein
MIDKVLQDSDTSDDAYALTSRAHIYMRQNKLKLAQEDLTAALKLDPKFPSAMALQIQLYVNQKKFSNALELAKKEAEYYPERWQTHINLGDSYAGLGDKEKTQSSYLKAISLHPSSPIIYIKVADYLNSIGCPARMLGFVSIDYSDTSGSLTAPYPVDTAWFLNKVYLHLNVNTSVELNRIEIARGPHDPYSILFLDDVKNGVKFLNKETDYPELEFLPAPLARLSLLEVSLRDEFYRLLDTQNKEFILIFEVTYLD